MVIKARAQQNLTKVFDGSGVFSIILTNENTSIPISSQGLALNYSGTSSDIYVYSGTSILTPVASNPNAGEYTLTAAGENITPGLITQGTNHASIAVASDFVTGEGSYSVTFTASGKDFLGNPFTAQKKQVITPLRHGDDATSYWVNTTSSVVMKDVNDNLQPSTVTVSAVSQEGFANAVPYGAIFKVYIRTGADFPNTPNYTSSAPETSHAVSLDTTINDIRIDMYSADGVNLLDTQTVPVIAQANGVINTKIQYTVTDTSVQPTDSNSWSDTIPTVGIGQFLWTKTTFYYTDGSNAVAYSMGHVGKDGASAPLLVLSSDSQAFTFDGDNNPSPANQTINLVAVLQNLTGTATFVATPYLNGAAGTPISLVGTGNARTLTVSQFGQVYDSVVVKASLGNLSDTETIHKLSDGSNGTPGSQGVPGAPGADGVSSYVHIAYANSSDGSLAFSTTDPTGRGYIGVLTDNSVPDSTDYTKYTWSLVKGSNGDTGPTGPTGATGPKGADGLSTYVHVAYANSSDGSTGFSTTDPSGKAYIGVLTDNSVPDSTDPTKYTWSLVKGSDGENGAQGIPGPAGADGMSTYIHFAYATNATGSTGFSTTDPTGKTYIGVYTDSAVLDSTDPTKYTWSLIQGPAGSQGPQGIPGPMGPNGLSTYVHFAYANNSDGTVGFSTKASGHSYIGVYTDTTQTGSTAPSMYTWSLIKGADGKDAVTGWLTNESITLQADSNGNVPSYTSATGSFMVYNGLTQVTGLTINQANAVGMTLGISGMDYSVTNMVADIAYVDLSVTYSGTTITKRLTLSKSKAGANGANGTSVVNSTTPPSNPTVGQWWNDMSVTPNVLKVYQSGNWIPYRIDAINLVAQSVTTDKLASNVLVASNVTYTNKNGTTTNLQTFDFDGIKTLLTDGDGNTYSSIDTAISSTQSWTSLSKQVNSLGQVNQLFNTEFTPDFAGWYTNTAANPNDAVTTELTPVGTDGFGSNVVSHKGGGNWINSAPIPVTPGMVLSFSSRLSVPKTVTSGTPLALYIKVFDANNGQVLSTGYNVPISQLTATPTTFKVENIVMPAGAVKAFAVYGWNVDDEVYISQPMLVFSSAVGAYVQGNYNNNARVLAIEQSASQFQVSIGQEVKNAQSTADTANTKVNNLSVGGRNLYLNSKALADDYGGAGTITVEPFDATTNMWHVVSPQGQGVAGIYLWDYAKGKIPDNQDWAYSADVKGTGTPSNFGIEAGSHNPVVGTVGSDWSRISQTGRLDSGTRKTPIMYFDTNDSPLDVYIKLPKLETGNLPTAWSPAPEDTQAGITSAQTSADSANTQLSSMALPNLFPNSDFDTDYGYRVKDGNTSLSLDHKDNIDGRYNGTVTVVSNTNWWQGYWARNIPVYGGQKYSMSVLVHYTNGGLSNGWATLDIWFVDKDGNRISTGDGGNRSDTTGQVDSPYWVKLYAEGITAPTNAAYVQVSLLVNDAGAGQTAIFTQPVVVASSKLLNYTPNDDIATTLKLTADNYTLGVTSDGNLISGITGNQQQVTLKGNMIKLDADTVIGNNFILQSANIGDLTAAKIKTGSISGPNLNIDLDTGAVLFQKGRIYSQGKEVDINIDQNYIRSYGKFGAISLEDGAIYLSGPVYDKPVITDGPSIDLYLSIWSVLMPDLVGQPNGYIGADIEAKDFLLLGLSSIPLSNGYVTNDVYSLGAIVSKATGVSIYGKDIGVNITGGATLNNAGLGNRNPRIAVGFNPAKDPSSILTQTGDDLKSNGILLDADSIVLADSSGTHGSITRDGVKTNNYTRYVASQNYTSNLPLSMGLERVGNMVMVSFNFTTYGSITRVDQVQMSGPKIPVGFRPVDNVHILANANNSGTSVGTVTFTITPDGRVLQTSPDINGVVRMMGSGVYLTYSVSPSVGTKVDGSTGDITP